jgi:hypothetical protein
MNPVEYTSFYDFWNINRRTGHECNRFANSIRLLFCILLYEFYDLGKQKQIIFRSGNGIIHTFSLVKLNLFNKKNTLFKKSYSLIIFPFNIVLNNQENYYLLLIGSQFHFYLKK